MTNLDKDDLSYIVSNLEAYMFKEIDAPMSSRTHLHMALYRIIENMDDSEIRDLPLGGIAQDVLVEHHFIFKNVPEKFSKFIK